MAEELKPCPWCASSALQVFLNQVCCIDCGCGGPDVEVDYAEPDNGDAAIERWNTRQAPAAEGWRPISEHDGSTTPVLIGRPSEFIEERAHVAWWDEDAYSDGGWWQVHDGKTDHGLRGSPPTHWMPLPAPPDSAHTGEVE